MTREILIVTTFKEFDGGRDDQIQRFWLENLKKQTYQKFKLVVTNFREKNVRRAISDAGIACDFFQSKNDCLYSLSDMLENAIQSIESGKNIVLYPSPDHIFDINFFNTIIKNFRAGGGGTSFPHAQYLSIDDYKNGIMYDEYFDRHQSDIFDYDPNKHIPETFYFDADLLLDEEWQAHFFRNKIYGTFPGVGLHLTMLAKANSLVNLVFKTRVHKIISHVDPKTNNLDMLNHLSDSHRSKEDWQRNGEIIMTYCESLKIPEKLYKGGLLKSRKIQMFCRFEALGDVTQKIKYELFKLRFTLFPVGSFILRVKLQSLWKKIAS
ncbi:MAG: hypothetical protein CMC82_02815 [Flavobacteriaceae bacterium]|nr:hypothetical protein [Flavobacteriaceae bacterium]